jgi:hypothetical protein
LKSILSILFLCLSFPAFAQTNYYVRTDGGSRLSVNKPKGQCDGTADVAYSPRVKNHKCAWGKLAYVAFDGSYLYKAFWGIKGGDIVHIGPGAFAVGLNSPVQSAYDGTSAAGNPFNAALPDVPGGTVGHPTTFIGAGTDKTQVYGTYGASAIFAINSPYVTIQDMELTDHEQCARGGSSGVNCHTDSSLSNFAANGIVTGTKAHDITLRNLNIHGFTSDGIRGAIGGLVTVDHVRLGFNGGGGWDFDDGTGTQSVNNSTVNASYLTVEGSGCNEEYPIVHAGFPALNCAGQDNAGYGDGVGTPGTPLNFTCDHCTFRYNTQDGLDLLHVSGSTIKVTNSTSYGNMGQQWKLGAMKSVLFENNTWVHNCRRMSAPIAGNSTYFKSPGFGPFCRAGGDGFGLLVMDGGSYVIRNNSYAGYGSTTYDIECATFQTKKCTEANVVFENNLHIGYKSPGDGQLPGVFYMDQSQGMPANPFKAIDHNIFFNMRSLPRGGVGTNPHIVHQPAWTGEASLDAVDFHLTPASINAIGKGVSVDIATDYDGVKRVNPPSIGAFEPTSAAAAGHQARSNVRSK